jgi:hypothetical protein
MSKSSMLAVLTAAMVSALAVVGSAQAANWRVAPAGGAFTATGGGTTLKVAGKTTSCVSTSASGTVTGSGGGVFSGPIFTTAWNAAATLTPAFSTCTNAGINYTVRCVSANLNYDASGYNGGATTTEADSAGKTTLGTLTGILCTIKPTASPSSNCATVTGSLAFAYTNPSTLAAGTGAANKGSLTISTVGQALNVASVGGCIASVGNGPATFGAVTYTVSGSPPATVAAPHNWA